MSRILCPAEEQLEWLHDVSEVRDTPGEITPVFSAAPVALMAEEAKSKCIETLECRVLYYPYTRSSSKSKCIEALSATST